MGTTESSNPARCSSQCRPVDRCGCQIRDDDDGDEPVLSVDENGCISPALADEECSALALLQVPALTLLEEYPLGLVTVAGEVPLAAGVETLSPQLVNTLLGHRSCVILDVRGADRASGLIDGCLHVPAVHAQHPFPGRVPELVESFKDKQLIIFFLPVL